MGRKANVASTKHTLQEGLVDGRENRLFLLQAVLDIIVKITKNPVEISATLRIDTKSAATVRHRFVSRRYGYSSFIIIPFDL